MIPIRGLRPPVPPREIEEPTKSRFRVVRAPRRRLWTEAMDARLGELWATGKPATRIAIQMSEECGRPLSMNAILGRAHRIGLQRRQNPVEAA